MKVISASMTETAYSSFFLESIYLLQKRRLLHITVVVCTDAHYGSGLCCPRYFSCEVNSKPAL